MCGGKVERPAGAGIVFWPGAPIAADFAKPDRNRIRMRSRAIGIAVMASGSGGVAVQLIQELSQLFIAAADILSYAASLILGEPEPLQSVKIRSQ